MFRNISLQLPTIPHGKDYNSRESSVQLAKKQDPKTDEQKWGGNVWQELDETFAELFGS